MDNDVPAEAFFHNTLVLHYTYEYTYNTLFTSQLVPMPPYVPYGLRGLPSRLWRKCSRLLMLGRPRGAVTLSRWGGW
jgi:hypothetical protein